MESIEAQIVPGTLNNKNVLYKLRSTLAIAEVIRGCVAFWTIEPNVLGPKFIELLKKDNSFYCIDIHSPTNLDSIASHYDLGPVNLFLHLKKTNKSKEHPSLPQYLLHGKIILFDLPDNKAEIWVGSHNLTGRALYAGNIEASTVISCDRDSNYYLQVNSYLSHIKNECQAFNPSLMDVYRSIQNESAKQDLPGENAYIVPMVGNNLNQLSNTTILLLGDQASDLQSLGLGRVTQKVYVHAIDIFNKEEAIFEATVRSSGEIIENDPLSFLMQFSNRLYAIRENTYFPYQSRRTKEVNGRDLESYRYWANIAIGKSIDHFELKRTPANKNKCWRWVKEDTTYYEVAPLAMSSCEKYKQLKEVTTIYRAVIDKQAKEMSTSSGTESQDAAFPFLKGLSDEELIAAQNFYRKNFEEKFFDSNQTHVHENQNSLYNSSGDFQTLPSFRRKKLGEKMKLLIKKPSGR